jgi:hypothetical protein
VYSILYTNGRLCNKNLAIGKLKMTSEENKLQLLKKYIALQAEDEKLWFIDPRTICEKYLQDELRTVAYLIEEATEDEIIEIINNYLERLNDA